MKILCPVLLYGGFFLLCMTGTGTEQKNIKNFWSYPEAVQNQIRKISRLSVSIPAQKSCIFSVLINTIVFTAVFVLINHICQIHIFQERFIYDLVLGEGLNLFDLLIIDALWWRHTERVSFEELPDPEDYQDMNPHLRSFLRAIPVFVLASVIAATL